MKKQIKEVLIDVCNLVISEVQNGKKTIKIKKIQSVLDGYDQAVFDGKLSK